MKKIISVLLILAVLILGAYYGMGVVTERTLKKNVTVLNQSQELLVNFDQYDRSWFKSNATLHWKLHVPSRTVKKSDGEDVTLSQQDYDFKMPLTIYHGPMMISSSGIRFGLGAANTHVILPKEFTDKFETIFTSNSSKPNVNLSVFVNYLNHTCIQLEVPAFKMIAKDNGQQFDWQGMKNNIQFSSDFNHVDGRLNFSGLQLMKDEMSFILSKLDSDYDLHLTDMGMYLGQGDLNVASFVISHQQDVLFDVDQFKMHSSSDVINGLFQSDVKISIDNLGTQGRKYQSAFIDMSLKNIDAKVLLEINDQMNKMQQGTDLQKQQALFSIFSELPKLVSKAAEFNITDLRVQLPEGKLKATLSLALPNETIGNPMELVQKVKGQAKIEIPADVMQAFVEESARQKLLKQSALQQAMVQQMQVADKNNDLSKTDGAVVSSKGQSSKDGLASVPKANESQETNKDSATTTTSDVVQQAKTLASEKIALMVSAGALAVQGKDYLIEMQLEHGQLMVNGKPFTAAMMPIL